MGFMYNNEPCAAQVMSSLFEVIGIIQYDRSHHAARGRVLLIGYIPSLYTHTQSERERERARERESARDARITTTTSTCLTSFYCVTGRNIHTNDGCIYPSIPYRAGSNNAPRPYEQATPPDATPSPYYDADTAHSNSNISSTNMGAPPTRSAPIPSPMGAGDTSMANPNTPETFC